MDGREAVAIVRAGGFVAAIEPMHSALPQGMVIEQDPPAGTLMGREAVVTLRLAMAPLEVARSATAIDDEASSGQAPRIPDPDDAEEWFKALSFSALDARRGGASGRHRRKHRRSRPSPHELVFDRAPQPSAAGAQPTRSSPPVGRTDGRLSVWPLITSAILAFHPWLTGTPLRRASALAVALALLLLLGIRASASSERRAQPPDHPALGGMIHAQPTVSESLGHIGFLPRRTSRSRHEPGSGHPTPRRAHRRAGVPNVDEAHATRRSGSPQAAAGRSAASAPSTGGQFAYLGQ
jgi:hypothetical protein